MTKTTTLIVAALAALLLVGSATPAAARSHRSNCVHLSEITQPNGGYGFRPYFLGIGSSWFHKRPTVPIPPATSGWCAFTQAYADLAGKASTDEARFYALYRAFPLHPTKAQWTLRFKPLALAAATTDADLAALVAKDAVDEAAAFNKQNNCGIPPNPPNLCDNEDLPWTAESVLSGGTGKTLLSRYAADRAWLIATSRAPYGAPIK